jgi:hypothetical protein
VYRLSSKYDSPAWFIYDAYRAARRDTACMGPSFYPAYRVAGTRSQKDKPLMSNL